VDGRLVFSKLDVGRFPAPEEIIALLRQGQKPKK